VLRPRPPELIERRNVTRIDPDLERRARRLAAEAREPFESSLCMTNAWFAACGALERGDYDVCLKIGFRERENRSWSEDPHGWISIAGQHFEPSPGTDPSAAVYLELNTRLPNDATRDEVFRSHEDLVVMLRDWAAMKP